MPRACKICTHPDQGSVKAAFASDATDRELAQRFSVSHMAIGRHRRQHIVRPMRVAVAALDRGRSNRQQRADQLALIEQSDPVAIATASLDFAAQAAKLERIEARLERMASAAEASQSSTGVAALAAQQFRGIETGSKLAGTGGYAHDKDAGQTAQKEKFSVVITFSGGQTTAITTNVNDDGRAVIDGPAPDDGAVIDADIEDDDASDGER